MTTNLTLDPSEYRYSNNQDQRALSDWDAVVREEHAAKSSLWGPALLGVVTLVLGVGGFASWAVSTELSSAAVAAGKVIVESNTKTVSHLEGGTLKELKVREGDRVKAGDVLALLDVTRSQSTLLQLRQELFAASTQLARLSAERDELSSVPLSDPLPDGMDPKAGEDIRKTERRLFEERTNLFKDQIAADQSAIEQLASQRRALEVRREAYLEQLKVVAEEFAPYKNLKRQKLITTAAFNTKKLTLVDLESRVAETDAALAENSQRKRQLELSLATRRTEYFRAISVEIQQTQSQINSIRQQIVAAKDIVAKAEIRSPQEGVIANIKVRTPGSAVIEGTPILDIVPADQPMLIEGTAPSMDIDQMRVGQKAEIKLTAFGAQELRPLIGQVIYIAPDSTVDERTGEARFVFKARIDDAELKAQPNLFLHPGMSAEVYIITQERTALAYLLEPVKRSFDRAFREQ